MVDCGGELNVFWSDADLAAGRAPLCAVKPAPGASVTFRGDLFHGIAPMRCGGEDGGERVGGG